MRLLACCSVFAFVSLARPALAQDPPPPIPWVAVDLHATLPGFPSDDANLAESRGMQVAELPGRGLGVQAGLHFYPLRTKVVTFGLGGEFAAGHASQTPAATVVVPLRAAEERFTTFSPQLSLNFGNGSGWSYVSVGLGKTIWYLAPDDLGEYPPNDDRLKTLNYGGGARWFIRPHVAFSLDVRFYAINPGTAAAFPPTPRTTLLIVGAGVSLK